MSTMLLPSRASVVVWECRAGGASPEVATRCHVHALLMRGNGWPEEVAAAVLAQVVEGDESETSISHRPYLQTHMTSAAPSAAEPRPPNASTCPPRCSCSATIEWRKSAGPPLAMSCQRQHGALLLLLLLLPCDCRCRMNVSPNTSAGDARPPWNNTQVLTAPASSNETAAHAPYVRGKKGSPLTVAACQWEVEEDIADEDADAGLRRSTSANRLWVKPAPP